MEIVKNHLPSTGLSGIINTSLVCFQSQKLDICYIMSLRFNHTIPNSLLPVSYLRDFSYPKMWYLPLLSGHTKGSELLWFSQNPPILLEPSSSFCEKYPFTCTPNEMIYSGISLKIHKISSLNLCFNLTTDMSA